MDRQMTPPQPFPNCVLCGSTAAIYLDKMFILESGYTGADQLWMSTARETRDHCQIQVWTQLSFLQLNSEREFENSHHQQ